MSLEKIWFVKFGIPIHIWNLLKYKRIVNNNFDVWMTKAVIEKLEREENGEHNEE